jgi:NADP-dependent 3-hydroxy acid dehydrogenase YdfG
MALGTAVIVGVGPGLGLELARIFGNTGHPVAMLARDKAKLDTFAKELGSTGLEARGYVTDAADPVNQRDVLSAAITEMGAPDVLVYNVGVLGPDSPTGGDDQKWALNTAINILGARVAADAVLPELRDGRGTLLFSLLPAPCSDWVVLGALGVAAAAGGGPLVPTGSGLGDVPAG